VRGLSPWRLRFPASARNFQLYHGQPKRAARYKALHFCHRPPWCTLLHLCHHRISQSSASIASSAACGHIACCRGPRLQGAGL
jgi:hypothetical protein